MVPVPAFPEGYMVPLKKQYKGPLADTTDLLQLSTVGYGAALPQSLTDARNPALIADLLVKRCMNANGVLKVNMTTKAWYLFLS